MIEKHGNVTVGAPPELAFERVRQMLIDMAIWDSWEEQAPTHLHFKQKPENDVSLVYDYQFSPAGAGTAVELVLSWPETKGSGGFGVRAVLALTGRGRRFMSDQLASIKAAADPA